jgi:hypothetical protein
LVSFRTAFIMAAWSPILQSVIQARIGASAPPVARQPLPSTAIKPAVGKQGLDSGGNDGLRADKIAALLRWYTSKEGRRHRRVLISAVALMANLSRETVYQARRGIMSERTRARLSLAISSIERGEVTFRRRGQHWGGEYHTIAPASPPRVLDPDNPLAHIQKINDYGRRPKTVPVDLGVITVNVCTGW